MRSLDLQPGPNTDGIRPVQVIRAEYLPIVQRFFLSLKATGETFFLAVEVREHVQAFIESDPTLDTAPAAALKRLLNGCPEIMIASEYTYAVLRPKIGVKRLVRLHPENDCFEEVPRSHYLMMKDASVQGLETALHPGLSINFEPYFNDFPKVQEPSEMGEGIYFLHRNLAGQMYQNPDLFRRALLRFLQDCHMESANLFVNTHLATPELLQDELDAMRALLKDIPKDTPYEDIAHDMRIHGFEAGWGATAGRVAQGLGMLARVVQSPDPARVEQLLGWLPLVRKILMVSPHGWFAQEGVLGKPDTGGQVTYVLDQARALERRMAAQFAESGVDCDPHIVILTRLIPNSEGTTCNVPREKVQGSSNCWIVRVPFHNSAGEVIPDWISRFQIWPYLETFAGHARQVITTEFLGKPDLIVGHYSDGNLAAYLLADALGVTHCAAVHALEKTKYLFSDMHWAEMEHDYRWSLHFTADIIAYNSADFIITSSYREIAGTEDEMGMFESYETFSMPGLYRVTSGLDPKLARFNIVPPGASEQYFFPHTDTTRRTEGVTQKLEQMVFTGLDGYPSAGKLANPALPPIFAMSRLDKVKNLSAFVEMYAKNATLRDQANLIILSSILDASLSSDIEEIEQIHRIHGLIEEHGLYEHIRWVAARLDKIETGEIYRVMADHRGVFAQPALMETFGLTVIEAMSCGLPVVVTCFGGPAEIVVPGVSGEVENPNDHDAFAGALERIVADSRVWQARSDGGIQRVAEAFNWPEHARRILQLSNVYSYWNFLDVMNRNALDQYIHTLYHTVFRPRARAITEGG